MASPILDLFDLSEDGVVVLGETLSLFVESDQPFDAAVNVTFRAFFTDAAGADREFTFSEALEAVPAQARTAGRSASRIKWVANLAKGSNPEAENSDCTVIFTASGAGVDGRRVVSQSTDRIVIRPIAITSDPRLTRIMVHEFSRPKAAPAPDDDDPFEFDPAPLQAYIDTLSPQQKKLLLNLKVARPEGRLVVFLTVYRQKPLRMEADFGPRDGSAHPNATFSVFHCAGPEKPVTLVCHTEHFLLNLRNGRTNAWLHAPQKGTPARDWLKKSNVAPPQFRIGSMLPRAFCDGVIWSRIFTADGQDIMRGNTMHGFVNTIGCWMLFRNFNWPVDRAATFDTIYRKRLRASGFAAAEAELANNGYDVPFKSADPARPGGVQSSLLKFLDFDRNHAYVWFFHDVVGIRYFSDSWRFASSRCVHDFRTHGRVFFNVFPPDKVGTLPLFALPDEGTFAYHDEVQRQRADRAALGGLDPAARAAFKPFVPDNALWRDNALGFKTSEGFLPETNGIFGNLTRSQAERFTWADLYVYAEDDVDITRLTRNYTEPGD